MTTDRLSQYCDKLRIGDKVLLTGTVYTARDAAHKRFEAFLDCRLCAMIANANTAKL
ncbi:MAG: fumarate hydratase C-terminal domain-containing protein [Oscillospiraceae bacterium]